MKNSIGPVSVIGPDTPEPPADIPFLVDRKNPRQQKLARMVGWDRLEQIARDEAAAQNYEPDESSPTDSPPESLVRQRPSPSGSP